jgi:formamidopyrimidine-DNA glycosylase
MPELPEVETSLRGIKPYVFHQHISDVIVRHPQLRWPVPPRLKQTISGQTVQRLYRRGKYLLFQLDTGTLLLHLGMSGRLCVLKAPIAPKKHDHVDICFANHIILRFTDPRRFGALLFTTENALTHPLLVNMGPEPLTKQFNSDYLWEQAKNKKAPIKSFIMNSSIVAGVGNIYATEALFQAGIRPHTPANKLTLAHHQKLVAAIQGILKDAIKKGGTTLKDFMKSDGTPGYFSIKLKAYGRAGQACTRCGSQLISARIGQRSTVYCGKCQG